VPDVAELLAAYDAQVRGRIPDPLPRGVTVERDGPLVRCFGLAGRGVLYRDLGGLEGGDLNELISRQVRVFAERGERFEWKLHGHDRPGDLPQWLRAAGFVPEDTETVVIAPVEDIAGDVRLTDRVSLREVTSRADFERIAALEQAVWGDEDQQSWLVDMLESERAVDPDGLTIIVAEAAATVVCAAWIRFERGTQFATLWGAATLPEWRRRGSTEQPWPTELTSPPAVASATSRRTLQALAARSSNVSASPRSPRPPHTCGLRRQFRQRTLSPRLSFDAAAPGLSTRAPAGDLPTRRDTASLGISRSTPSGSKKGREPRRQQAEGDGGSHSPRIRTSPTGAAGSTPSAYTRIVTERPPYFFGQLIGVDDLEQEQLYHREKARRHNRFLHGWGIVHGPEVRAGTRGTRTVTISPGYALDRRGEEIVVSRPVAIDLFRAAGCHPGPRGLRLEVEPGSPLDKLFVTRSSLTRA
jgi:hypothetical protein